MKKLLALILVGVLAFSNASYGAITYTRDWTSADDGSTLGGQDIGNIQDDVSEQAATQTGNNAYTGSNTHAGTETFNGTVNFNSTVTGVAVIQVVNTQSSALQSGATAIPQDDSKPEDSEGFAFTDIDTAITPTSATNLLKIDVVFQGASSANNGTFIVALHNADLDADFAIAVGASSTALVDTTRTPITFTYFVLAGTTSATTFKIRAGNASGDTVTMNGISTGPARRFGGAMYSSITITEITP